MSPLVGRGQPAEGLLARQFRGTEGERDRRIVPLLRLAGLVVHRVAVNARRRPGLEASEAQAQTVSSAPESPVAARSPTRPPGVCRSPVWRMPWRNVPVVTTTARARIVEPSSRTAPAILPLRREDPRPSRPRASGSGSPSAPPLRGGSRARGRTARGAPTRPGRGTGSGSGTGSRPRPPAGPSSRRARPPPGRAGPWPGPRWRDCRTCGRSPRGPP